MKENQRVENGLESALHVSATTRRRLCRACLSRLDLVIEEIKQGSTKLSETHFILMVGAQMMLRQRYAQGGRVQTTWRQALNLERAKQLFFPLLPKQRCATVPISIMLRKISGRQIGGKNHPKKKSRQEHKQTRAIQT